MSLVDVIIESDLWSEIGLDSLAAEACGAALVGLNLDAARFEISLLACDDDRISALNEDFRGKPLPTNVLSWPTEVIELPLGQSPELPNPADDGSIVELGDIAIAFETCQREAKEQNKPFVDHVRHLLVHGTLHLLGFDHINDADAAHMEGLETRILATLGVPDPY